MRGVWAARVSVGQQAREEDTAVMLHLQSQEQRIASSARRHAFILCGKEDFLRAGGTAV